MGSEDEREPLTGIEAMVAATYLPDGRPNDERALIVAWLRQAWPSVNARFWACSFADAIERGDHRKPVDGAI